MGKSFSKHSDCKFKICVDYSHMNCTFIIVLSTLFGFNFATSTRHNSHYKFNNHSGLTLLVIWHIYSFDLNCLLFTEATLVAVALRISIYVILRQNSCLACVIGGFTNIPIIDNL